MPRDSDFALVNASEIERALKKVDKDLQRETRRMMAAESRKVRDEVRGDFTRGPTPGGHAFRAVTSGTKGLRPTLKLRRDYRPYVGWLVFGGRRRRYYPLQGAYRVDREPRRAPEDGFWFYPGVKRARRRVTDKVRQILADAIRDAGLD